MFKANKRPSGEALINLYQAFGALVEVQYKMLELEERRRCRSETVTLRDDEQDDQEWVVPIDNQFKDEFSRMRRFDRDLNPAGPCRLSSSAFF